MDVMSAIDFIDAHMLPFFSTEASRGEPTKNKFVLLLTYTEIVSQRANPGQSYRKISIGSTAMVKIKNSI
jgi:hypothetical protein